MEDVSGSNLTLFHFPNNLLRRSRQDDLARTDGIIDIPPLHVDAWEEFPPIRARNVTTCIGAEISVPVRVYAIAAQVLNLNQQGQCRCNIADPQNTGPATADTFLRSASSCTDEWLTFHRQHC